MIGQARSCVLPLGIRRPHSNARVGTGLVHREKDAGQHALTASWTHYGEGFSMESLLAQCGLWRQCTVKLVVFTVAVFYTVSVGLASDIPQRTSQSPNPFLCLQADLQMMLQILVC